MPKSPLISLQWLPHSPLPSTLRTNLPFCEQSMKNSRKREKRRRSVLLGYSNTQRWRESKPDFLLLKNEKSLNPLVSVEWSLLPIWKKGNSSLTASKSSLGLICLSCASLFEWWSLGACGKQCPISWPGTSMPRAPHISHAQNSGTAPCFSAKRHHLGEWQGLAAPLEFLSLDFQYLLITQVLLSWSLSYFLPGAYW